MAINYSSRWQTQIDDLIKKVNNREEFSFDVNNDALMQNIKSQAISSGKLAMEDTMAKANGMTGGHGSSYSQGVAQQAYQGELQKIGDKAIPVAQMAFQKYQSEGDALLRELGLLKDQEAQDYARYQEAAAQERYQQEMDYRKEQDKLAQDRWQKEFDENKRRYEESKNPTYSGGGGGSGGGGSGGGGYSGYDNGGYSESDIRAAQKFVGADADGMWGRKSDAAAKKAGYGSLAEVIEAMKDNGGGGGGSEYTTRMNRFLYIAPRMSKQEQIKELQNPAWGFTDDQVMQLIIDLGITDRDLDQARGGRGGKGTANYLN